LKRLVTSGLWFVLGISIGAGAVLTDSHVQAQQQTGVGIARLVMTPASGAIGQRIHAGWPPINFIKDTKSGGCWIGSIGENGFYVSIAVAPPAACE
jgi:hypothetical protein